MSSKYEMSKTFQYRKVMKPMLERKRRARINKCLDDLKALMGECLQQQHTNDPDASKFEKADILEVTVEHLRKLRQSQKNATNTTTTPRTTATSFRDGYIHAANEVSRCLASVPNVDVALGTQLMTHLGMRLNQLEAPQQQNSSVHSPLSIQCSGSNNNNNNNNRYPAPSMCSPNSSGYGSDCESLASSSSAPPAGLLRMTNTVWRPW